MYIILLEFGAARDQAQSLMSDHQAWIERGFADGVFLLVGSLRPKLGGVILARGPSLDVLQRRVNDDPFVKQGVVQARILDVDASRLDPRLDFLRTPASDQRA